MSIEDTPMMQRKFFLKAFSMPEVLLSVFVLTTGLTTIVAVMSGSLRFALNNRDTIIATELAQEGIELVRNVRDNDFASGGNGFPSAAFDTAKPHCRADWNDPVTSLRCRASRGGTGPASVRYDLTVGGTGLYAHSGSGAGQGKFSRYIYLDYDNTAGNENALVRSFVYWGSFAISAINEATGDSSPCVKQFDATGHITGGCVFTETFLTAWK